MALDKTNGAWWVKLIASCVVQTGCIGGCTLSQWCGKTGFGHHFVWYQSNSVYGEGLKKHSKPIRLLSHFYQNCLVVQEACSSMFVVVVQNKVSFLVTFSGGQQCSRNSKECDMKTTCHTWPGSSSDVRVKPSVSYCMVQCHWWSWCHLIIVILFISIKSF